MIAFRPRKIIGSIGLDIYLRIRAVAASYSTQRTNDGLRLKKVEGKRRGVRTVRYNHGIVPLDCFVCNRSREIESYEDGIVFLFLRAGGDF